MPRPTIPHGVIPAVLLPFDNDLAIDEPSFRKHLRDVAATPGISAITVNAHSTEVASCSFEEQRRVLEIARDEIGERIPIVNGIWADGSLEAARIARMATQGGASALLVFPPAPFTLGQSPEMALAHFKRIADASDLPLIVFQYPLATGQGYPNDTLLRLCEEVPSIRAIKDWVGNVPHHELHIRTLQSLPRPVNVLTTHSAWLFSLAGARLQRPAVRQRQRDPRFAGAAVPGRASQRPRGGAPAQRSHRAAGPRVLCRTMGRHAQPHEGGAGAARPAAARGGAAAAGQARRRRDRAHPQAALVEAGLLGQAAGRNAAEVQATSFSERPSHDITAAYRHRGRAQHCAAVWRSGRRRGCRQLSRTGRS